MKLTTPQLKKLLNRTVYSFANPELYIGDDYITNRAFALIKESCNLSFLTINDSILDSLNKSIRIFAMDDDKNESIERMLNAETTITLSKTSIILESEKQLFQLFINQDKETYKILHYTFFNKVYSDILSFNEIDYTGSLNKQYLLESHFVSTDKTFVIMSTRLKHEDISNILDLVMDF